MQSMPLPWINCQNSINLPISFSYMPIEKGYSCTQKLGEVTAMVLFIFGKFRKKLEENAFNFKEYTI